MESENSLLIKNYGIIALNVAAFLLCAVLGVSQAAYAQETAPTQQLPDQAAQEQIPQTFPLSEDTNNAQKIPQPSTDIENINAGSANAPAQPEERRLVPATPMGSAAQSADGGLGGAQEGQGADTQSPANVSNPENTGNENVSDMVDPVATPAEPDLLQQYTQASEESENALPPASMPSGQGLGVESAANPALAMQEEPKEEKTPEELKEEIRTEAYDAAVTGMFPLNPDQISGILTKYDETQKATQEPVYKLPTPEVSVQNVSLDPGVVPLTIKTAVGNVTTLNILDATGAPWPVQDVTWAGDYEVVEPEEGGHIIRITPMSHFARGNIVIRLLTLKTPLTMTLVTGRDIVQYRVDARIPEYGPFASAPIMQGGKSMVAGNTDLTSILDGVMPGNALKLSVSGVDGRTTAYAMGGTTYVRTPLTLLSPAWQSSVSSADGMNVYALSNAPVLLLSDGGEFQRATLSEKEDLLDE